MSRFAKSVVMVFAAMLMGSAARAGEGAAAIESPRIDWRFAPPWWQTSICLPDDWQKTLVGKDGELLYDWGGGRYRGFKTRIGVGITDMPVWTKQELIAPRVPIVRTIYRLGDLELMQEAFAAPPADQRPIEPQPPVIERLGSSVLANWANPAKPCENAYRHIAVGFGESIHYRFRAAAGRKYTVVFGLCEGWHQQPGQRLMDLQIEGATVRTVDTFASFGRNAPALLPFAAKDENGDGFIDVVVAAAKNAGDKNTILNVLWVFEGDAPPAGELIAGKSSRAAVAHVACGMDVESNNPPRNDVVLVTLKNTGAAQTKVTPVIAVESAFPVAGGEGDKAATIGGSIRLVSTLPFTIEQHGDGRAVMLCEPLQLAASQQKVFAIGISRGRQTATAPASVEDAVSLRAKAEQYWRSVDLPYDHIQVPDAGIQAMIDSSIRNIYQAREIKENLPAFQVGPTCYRGLWVVDGSFLMEAIALLGRGDEARNGIRYLLKRQGKDGGFMLMDGHWKETGIVLWAVSRHARLTGDKEWLLSIWPNIERGFAFIQNMRRIAATDPKAPNYRLVPGGFSDGGLGEKGPEYTNIYWTLSGVKAAVESAEWLGKIDQRNEWQKEYDDFFATFRKAAERDMKTDARGNRCLPIYMVNGLRVPPQKAQWAFLHAIYPGKLFSADDPLVKGNMAMLRAAECEGLVQDTGWLKDGLWNYFGSFYGHAWLWLGEPQRAIAALYAFGNHASPLLVWREEHMPQGKGDGNVGDMPHNWASAEFIRLVRNCLVLERGNELHLLEAMPAAWARAGMVTKLKDIATEFGPISLELRVSADGKMAELTVDVPQRTPPKATIVHLDTWAGKSQRVALPASRQAKVEIPLRVR